MKKKSPRFFFGWENIKWFIREFRDIWSPRKTYFSKKRIESSIAFIIGQWGMIYFFLINISKMTTQDVLLWSGVEFAISGYMVYQIQKEKVNAEPVVEEDDTSTNVCPACNQQIIEDSPAVSNICPACNQEII